MLQEPADRAAAKRQVLADMDGQSVYNDRGMARITGRPGSLARLLIIPLLVYIVWVLETYLLEGSLHVLHTFQPWQLLIYTVMANIFIGIFAPVLCMRSAFMSGAVNMFQTGFRSLRRTIVTSGITACAGYLALVIAVFPGSQRAAFPGAILLMLPLGIASVMICWVFIGTHLQAYIRSYGAAMSILFGVALTAFLFGLSFLAHSPPFNDPVQVLTAIGIGTASGIFFFSVRDMYASVIFVTFSLCWFARGQVDPAYLAPVSPLLAATGLLSLLALIGSHYYLSRRFITVRLPVAAMQARKP